MKNPVKPRGPKKPKKPRAPSAPRSPSSRKPLESRDAAQQSIDDELTDTQRAFRERNAKEQTRNQTATDPGYYFCVVAESREQADAILEKLGVMGEEDLFVDARIVARKLGVDLPPAKKGSNNWTINSDYAGLAGFEE